MNTTLRQTLQTHWHQDICDAKLIAGPVMSTIELSSGRCQTRRLLSALFTADKTHVGYKMICEFRTEDGRATNSRPLIERRVSYIPVSLVGILQAVSHGTEAAPKLKLVVLREHYAQRAVLKNLVELLATAPTWAQAVAHILVRLETTADTAFATELLSAATLAACSAGNLSFLQQRIADDLCTVWAASDWSEAVKASMFSGHLEISKLLFSAAQWQAQLRLTQADFMHELFAELEIFIAENDAPAEVLQRQQHVAETFRWIFSQSDILTNLLSASTTWIDQLFELLETDATALFKQLAFFGFGIEAAVFATTTQLVDDLLERTFDADIPWLNAELTDLGVPETVAARADFYASPAFRQAVKAGLLQSRQDAEQLLRTEQHVSAKTVKQHRM